MTTKRVYKPAFSNEESVALMMESRSRHFDPDMVDAMQSIDARFQAIANRYRDDAA